MSVDSQRGLYVRVAHLLLQDSERHGLLGEFRRQTMSECVKSRILRLYTQLLEHRLQTVLHDVVSPARVRSLRVRKEEARWIRLPMAFEILSQHGFQSGRHREHRGRVLGFGLTYVSRVVIRRLAYADGFPVEVEVADHKRQEFTGAKAS